MYNFESENEPSAMTIRDELSFQRLDISIESVRRSRAKIPRNDLHPGKRETGEFQVPSSDSQGRHPLEIPLSPGTNITPTTQPRATASQSSLGPAHG